MSSYQPIDNDSQSWSSHDVLFGGSTDQVNLPTYLPALLARAPFCVFKNIRPLIAPTLFVATEGTTHV